MSKTDNQRYIKRGYDLFIHYNPAWEEDLKRENHHKEGAPFRYCQAMIMMIAGLKISLGIPYRQLDGLLKHMMLGRKTPHYSTIQKRIAKLDVNISIWKSRLPKFVFRHFEQLKYHLAKCQITHLVC